jgi:hypothetical protein
MNNSQAGPKGRRVPGTEYVSVTLMEWVDKLQGMLLIKKKGPFSLSNQCLVYNTPYKKGGRRRHVGMQNPNPKARGSQSDGKKAGFCPVNALYHLCGVASCFAPLLAPLCARKATSHLLDSL